MLFKLAPKENRSELYDRERELEELHRLSKTEWIVILGKRMTGKTSVLKTFLNEVGGIYVNLMGVRSIKGLIEELLKHTSRMGLEISLPPILRISWTRLAVDVFSRLEEKIVGLDEVQELPANYFLKLLKKIWDTYDIRIVFTGSMMGVIKKLLEPGAESPMYGRKPAVVELKPFTRSQSIDFLEKGFTECGIRVREEEIIETVELLDGYVGWLTYYGNYRCIRRLSHEEALRNVYTEGRKIMLEELNHFLENKKNKEKYIQLLKNLPARWSDLEAKLGVNSKILRQMLLNLENAFLVEKHGNTYVITDPILRKLVGEL